MNDLGAWWRRHNEDDDDDLIMSILDQKSLEEVHIFVGIMMTYYLRRAVKEGWSKYDIVGRIMTGLCTVPSELLE